MRPALSRAGLIAGGLALAVGLGFGAAQVLGGGARVDGSPSQAAPTAARGLPSTVTQLSRTTGLDRLLGERNHAIARHDPAAWMQTVDLSDRAFAAQQRGLFATISALPVQTWTYRSGGAGPELPDSAATARGGQDAWIARVVLTYRLAGFDRAVVTRDAYPTVVLRSGRWLLAGDRDAVAAGQPGQPEVWDLGPTTVVRGARSLVVGRLPRAVLAQRAAEAA